MTETMEAIRIAGPGTPDDLRVSTVPLPPLQPGWARIRVRAFGINESEATSLAGGSSPHFTYPRILGIEATGTIDTANAGSRFAPGEQVMTMMGGMGRSVDGSYAQYVTVPEEQIIPFSSDLPWSLLGAIPEMFQTAHGSLTTGLDLRAEQTLLVRGGTSTVGLSATALAHDRGATVLSTTRDPARADLLREHGARHVLIDDGHLSQRASGNSTPKASTPLSSSSASTRSQTRSAASGEAASPASPGPSATNGRWTDSARSS